MLPTIHFTDLLMLAGVSALIGAVAGSFITIKVQRLFKPKVS